jgi:hypothetical protein
MPHLPTPHRDGLRRQTGTLLKEHGVIYVFFYRGSLPGNNFQYTNFHRYNILLPREKFFEQSGRNPVGARSIWTKKPKNNVGFI